MQNNVSFGWSKPQQDEIYLSIKVGENGFSIGICFDASGESSWFIVSADGVTPQKWGSIPKECTTEIVRLLTPLAVDETICTCTHDNYENVVNPGHCMNCGKPLVK